MKLINESLGDEAWDVRTRRPKLGNGELPLPFIAHGPIVFPARANSDSRRSSPNRLSKHKSRVMSACVLRFRSQLAITGQCTYTERVCSKIRIGPHQPGISLQPCSGCPITESLINGSVPSGSPFSGTFAMAVPGARPDSRGTVLGAGCEGPPQYLRTVLPLDFPCSNRANFLSLKTRESSVCPARGQEQLPRRPRPKRIPVL